MNEARKLPAPSLDATIGANVHTLMWRAQHTQTAIAHELGMSQAALSLKLRGKRPWYADEIDHLARKYKWQRRQSTHGARQRRPTRRPIQTRTHPR